MNWIERLYEIKNKDLYSQNGEGLILEHICHVLDISKPTIIDIGGGNGLHLSNSRHMSNLGCPIFIFDREIGIDVTTENILQLMAEPMAMLSIFNSLAGNEVVSIDIDGNDYWILEKIMGIKKKALIIIAEFNAMYTDSRTIKYNPDHAWAGDSYYGFTFEAGKKLAEKHGYKVIFQVADINMFMVRADLIEGLEIPEVTFKQNDFFKLSDRTDWVMI